MGNTREQLFQVCRSFHYDENTEMLHTYVTRIRQVAALLGYGKPQILEVFENKFPKRLYWVPFSIDDLRQKDTNKGEGRQTTGRPVNLNNSIYEVSNSHHTNKNSLI